MIIEVVEINNQMIIINKKNKQEISSSALKWKIKQSLELFKLLPFFTKICKDVGLLFLSVTVWIKRSHQDKIFY